MPEMSNGVAGLKFKGGSFADLRDALVARHAVVVAIGEATPLIHAALNGAVRPHDFVATHTAEEARARGRYVLEDGAHVDVLVARQQSTKDGDVVKFDDVWTRRAPLTLSGATVFVPSIDDLIRTKRWSMRPKDIQDIQMLENLRKATS